MFRLRPLHVPITFLTVAARTVYFLSALALIAAAAALFVVLVLDVIMSYTGGVTQTVDHRARAVLPRA